MWSTPTVWSSAGSPRSWPPCCAASTSRCSRRISIAATTWWWSTPKKIRLTGRKRERKTYYRHTGYPGGIKSTTPEKILSGAHPERVVEKAVRRMLPKGPLGRKQFGKLKVYAGPDHPHEAQRPEALDVAALNPKNARSR